MRLAVVAAVLLRREEPAPSFDAYLGFPEEADTGNLTALAPVTAVQHVAPEPFQVNSTQEPRVRCPRGVNANVPELEWRLRNEPRLHAKSSQPVQQLGSYLFVIAPPGYGSTAIMSLLASSPSVGTLCASGSLNCEGCFILYHMGMMKVEDRWDRDQPKSWVDATAAFDLYYPPGKPLKLEKSPNNIVKTQQIAEQLTAAGHSVRFVIMSRSPCFVGAAGHHGAGIYTWAWEFFAKEMLASMHRGVPAFHLQYEELLADPYKVAAGLLDFMPELGSLDPSVNVLQDQGGTMYKGKKQTTDRAKSIVQYLLEYQHIAADHESVDGKYRSLMAELGYATPPVGVPLVAR